MNALWDILVLAQGEQQSDMGGLGSEPIPTRMQEDSVWGGCLITPNPGTWRMSHALLSMGEGSCLLPATIL